MILRHFQQSRRSNRVVGPAFNHSTQLAHIGMSLATTRACILLAVATAVAAAAAAGLHGPPPSAAAAEPAAAGPPEAPASAAAQPTAVLAGDLILRSPADVADALGRISALPAGGSGGVTIDGGLWIGGSSIR